MSICVPMLPNSTTFLAVTIFVICAFFGRALTNINIHFPGLRSHTSHTARLFGKMSWIPAHQLGEKFFLLINDDLGSETQEAGKLIHLDPAIRFSH